MIRPSKHAHPDLTVMSVASVILERLKKKRTETFADLVSLVERHTRSAKTLFPIYAWVNPLSTEG
jgi:hypothetical protein